MVGSGRLVVEVCVVSKSFFIVVKVACVVNITVVKKVVANSAGAGVTDVVFVEAVVTVVKLETFLQV